MLTLRKYLRKRSLSANMMFKLLIFWKQDLDWRSRDYRKFYIVSKDIYVKWRQGGGE